jgi:hypothetical protein
MDRRLAQIEESVARYLSKLDTADRHTSAGEEPVLAARTTRLEENLPSPKTLFTADALVFQIKLRDIFLNEIRVIRARSRVRFGSSDVVADKRRFRSTHNPPRTRAKVFGPIANSRGLHSRPAIGAEPLKSGENALAFGQFR